VEGEWLARNGFTAFAGYPLLIEDRLVGVLAVFARRPISVALPEALGSLVHGIAVGIQRKRAEDDLRTALVRAEESDRLKGAFLANISHEIRTPLNVILGYTSLIADDFAERGDDSQHAVLGAIRRASDRLLRTMGAILDLSKMTAGAFDVQPEVIDLASEVERQAVQFQAVAKEKGLELSCSIDDRAVCVRFDAYCLSQSVMHLLDNAIKFTRSGGVRVTLFRQPSGECALEIEDTGIGMDATYLPRIFTLFTQEHSGYTRPFEGAGLGLALTKSYLEKNGASIAIDSVRGRGSKARIVFPPALLVAKSASTPAAAISIT
jgi:signal transduction histidine kinase